MDGVVLCWAALRCTIVWLCIFDYLTCQHVCITVSPSSKVMSTCSWVRLVCSSGPSASTELFLRLEAAAAHEPEASTAGLQDSSQLPVASVCAHAADGHHATPSVQCMAPPLQAQLPVAHIQWQQPQQQQQQPVKLQQQLSEQAEDVYAGLERGSDTVPMLTPSWHSEIATPAFDQAHKAPAPALSTVPQQGPSRMTSEQGLSRKSPEHGSLRHRDQPGLQCKAEPSGKVTPKAAEAPLLKQGSYAVAAKIARLRKQRRQQEVEELNGSQRQVQLAAGGKQPALQVVQTLPVHKQHCGTIPLAIRLSTMLRL